MKLNLAKVQFLSCDVCGFFISLLVFFIYLIFQFFQVYIQRQCLGYFGKPSPKKFTSF
uniref:Uncharacterized protein n=1 Tax=Anguilla anguilla TaxID=7936 RepID=A0A0E9WMC0_ANGAN